MSRDVILKGDATVFAIIRDGGIARWYRRTRHGVAIFQNPRRFGMQRSGGTPSGAMRWSADKPKQLRRWPMMTCDWRPVPRRWYACQCHALHYQGGPIVSCGCGQTLTLSHAVRLP